MSIASTQVLADAWDYNGHMGGGWWVVMVIGMVVFWGAVIIGIAWLVRGGSPNGWRGERSETPIEILERRFAEGAMTADEYHERRQVLTSASGQHRS